MFALTKWDSPIYQEALDLRNRILRASAGKAELIKSPTEEIWDIHLVVKQDQQVVGTLLLHPVSKTCIQMKQVAVEPALQGQKIGKNLLIYAEQVARNLGFTTIFLTGRKQAWGFYERMSYQATQVTYQEGPLEFKIFKKNLHSPFSRMNRREMKTNG